jgi:hypothetical protein
MRFPVIILALLSLLYRVAEPGTMAPTQTLVNPHYFGSRNIFLTQTTLSWFPPSSLEARPSEGYRASSRDPWARPIRILSTLMSY